MIVWDRDRKFKGGLSVEKREELIDSITTKSLRHKLKNANLLCNIALPASAFLIFGFDPIAIAATYICSDIILCGADNLLFNVIPYIKNNRMSLDSVEKRIEKMEAEIQDKKDEISKLRQKYCSNCNNCYSWSRSNCTSCTTISNLVGDIEQLEEFIREEKKYLRNERDKIKELEIKQNTKKSNDYDNKMLYFDNLIEKLVYYKREQGVEYLDSVIEGIKKLRVVLEEKPLGLSLVEGKLYIYLDELQAITENLFNLPKEKREVYIEKIGKITEKLCSNIDSLISRIEMFEVEDIEVSIDVLLKELEAEEGKLDV